MIPNRLSHSMPIKLRHEDIEMCRHTPQQSVLLFITDRCPVGCAHCSVDSKTDSPTISDFALFENLLIGICNNPAIEVVGISGGEPFVERRGLSMANDYLARHNKTTVIYTSGVWANNDRVPEWIRSILKTTATVYLSTDTFHQTGVPTHVFIRAAQAIAEEGAWIIVQTLEPDQAGQLLERAFGSNYEQFAEIVPLSLLSNGRGGQVFTLASSHKGKHFGHCSLAVTPVVRYDGVVTACCNESIIMGQGPERLRRHATSASDLKEGMAAFNTDPLLAIIANTGLGTLTEHPRLKQYAEQRYTNPCSLCWDVMAQFPEPTVNDRLIHAIAALKE